MSDKGLNNSEDCADRCFDGCAGDAQAAKLPRVLVVDDDRAIADLVVRLLQPEGFDAAAFTNPALALAAFKEHPFDMAILDVMMPVMDGYELCGHIRQISEVPILFLSARDEESDQVVGFSMGADDYVTKPFKPRELVARVRAHLRRAQRSHAPERANVLYARGLSVDLLAHEAALHDQPLAFTPKEFAVLALLMQRMGKPVSSADIYERVWDEPYDTAAANTVMVHIRHIRAKLAELDSSAEFVETVWGVGYRIAKDPGER